MKGIIYSKIGILCKTVVLKTLLLLSRAFLRKNNDFLPAKENRSIQRDNPRKHYISKNKRSHHEPAYHDHRYYNLLTLPILSIKTGQRLKIVAIKRQEVSSRAGLFSKSVNQVNDCVIIWPPNQDIVL
jgi:hypothetical protein